MPPLLWTIGHSRHTAARLLDLLEGQGVSRLIDVRSVPYSRRHPQHNRERLAAALEGRGIAYHWEGEALGGRPDKAGRADLCGPDGAPDWGKVRAEPEFREALARLRRHAEERPSAILCAEEDPRRCHRLHLVSAAWAEEVGEEIFHIRGNGRVETQKEVAPPLADDPQLALFGVAPQGW
ncbi:MAG: DUF488 domain-containing protein, partial [bacterium]